jgi:hypothetical protein
LKGIVVGQDFKGFVVVVLNIGDNIIPCAWMFGVVHAQDMCDHSIDGLCLSIILGVEGGGFGDLGVQ